MTARILVVDDIPANVRLLAAKLGAEYFEVTTATSGAEALNLIANREFDLILLDVMMPGMSGIEVCKKLRSQASTALLPIIMVSALETQDDRNSGLEAGADDFITKPVNDMLLLGRIDNLLRHRRRLNRWGRISGSGDKGQQDFIPLDRSRIEATIAVFSDGDSPDMKHVGSIGPNIRVRQVDPLLNDRWIEQCADVDLALLVYGSNSIDPLRLISTLKAYSNTQVLLVVDPHDLKQLRKALDLGVDDYIVRPIDDRELQTRIINLVWRNKLALLFGGSKAGNGEGSLANHRNGTETIHDGGNTSELATPMPRLTANNRVDANADPLFDTANDNTKLEGIVRLQRALLSTIIRSLPAQCPRSLMPALELYDGELEHHQKGVLTDVLKSMFQIITADVDAQTSEEEWLSEGTRRAFDLFASNHSSILDQFPHAAQKEKAFEQFEIDEELAQGSRLSSPIEKLRTSVAAASDSNVFTENFVKVVDAMTKHAQALASHTQASSGKSPAESSSTIISPRRRFVVSTLGFAERTYNIIGTSATLVGFAASPQGQAILLRLAEIIARFSSFIM